MINRQSFLCDGKPLNYHLLKKKITLTAVWRVDFRVSERKNLNCVTGQLCNYYNNTVEKDDGMINGQCFSTLAPVTTFVVTTLSSDSQPWQHVEITGKT